MIVRETVPDSMLERADEIELVDLPADDLLQRLQEGKVYVPQQARDAIRNFFRKGNLIALRELALRRTAERVDAEMQAYMRDHAIEKTWPVAERLLVCVGPSPFSAQLVRAGRRLADRLGARWIVAHVETPAHARLPQTDRDRVVQTLRLAEQLGAETVTLSGATMSEEILAYARARNVSRIVLGKPARSLWRRILLGSIVDALVRGSGEIDIHVISGEGEPAPARVPPIVASVAAFDVFFVPPYLSFAVYQCSPFFINTSLHPVVVHLERAAGFSEGEPVEAKLGKLEALLSWTAAEVADAPAVLAALLSLPAEDRYPPLNLSPQRQKERTLEILVGQLASLSDSRPVVVVFEDVPCLRLRRDLEGRGRGRTRWGSAGRGGNVASPLRWLAAVPASTSTSRISSVA